MKLPHLGVLFTLILLPLILVLSYYIQLQVDTIRLQTSYNSDLLDATYDAMASLEINTANEDLSAVSDALRTIIDASSNVFMSSLATNLGVSNASKSFVEPYIPALVYTLYDGYYIYAPTRVPTVLTDQDGNAISVGDVGVKKSETVEGTYTFPYEGGNTAEHNNYIQYLQDLGEIEKGNITTEIQNRIKEYERTNTLKYTDLDADRKSDYGQLLFLKEIKSGIKCYTTNIAEAQLTYKNVLKSYMPYSARYIKEDDAHQKSADITVTYTLDNYVTIEGEIGGVYYTKSGYLLPKDTVKVTCSDHTGDETDYLYWFNQNDAQKIIEGELYYNPNRTITVEISEDGTAGKNSFTVSGSITKKDYEADIRALNNQKTNIHSIIRDLTIDPSGMNIGTINSRLGEVRDMMKKLHGPVNTNYNDFTIPDSSSIDAVITKLNEVLKGCLDETNVRQYELDKISAAVYYTKGKIFSDWVYKTLGKPSTENPKAVGIQEKDIVEVFEKDLYLKLRQGEEREEFYDATTGTMKDTGIKDTSAFHKFKKGADDADDGDDADLGNNYIFDTTSMKNTNSSDKITAKTEIDSDSIYYTHKINVIKNSIQYNLNLTLSAFNESYYNTNSRIYYQMPMLSDSQWEQILSRISLVSFMQGLHCGLKTYSNYMIVSSTNNEILTAAEDIYYTEVSSFNNENDEYHKINCFKLIAQDAADKEYIGFASKDVKFDKIYDKTNKLVPYKYDHKNYACYNCINDRNYDEVNIFDKAKTEYDSYINLRKAYYIGVGKTRNNIYKMNAVEISEGFETIYQKDKFTFDTAISKVSTLPLENIRAIEITLGQITFTSESRRPGNNVSSGVEIGGHPINDELYGIPTTITNSTRRVLNVIMDPIKTCKDSSMKSRKVEFYDGGGTHTGSDVTFTTSDPTVVISEEIHAAVDSIKVLYK